MKRSMALRATPAVAAETLYAPPIAERHPARPAPVEVSPGLVALKVEAFDEAARIATLRLGREVIDAHLDDAVDVAVVKTALARGERVIAQREADGWILIGALRTAATPGVDEGEEFTIKGKRIRFQADHELSFVTGAASLVLRAFGQVETMAESITARASSVHKIIGRVIRLN